MSFALLLAAGLLAVLLSVITFLQLLHLESLRLRYRLSKVSRVTVGIYNAAGTRVRHIVPRALMPAGIPLSAFQEDRVIGN